MNDVWQVKPLTIVHMLLSAIKPVCQLQTLADLKSVQYTETTEIQAAKYGFAVAILSFYPLTLW